MIPKIYKLNNLSKEENYQVMEVCKEFKALPQSSTRVFTSKFKAGTLPLQAYSIAEPETVDENPDEDFNKDTIGDFEDANSGAGHVDEPAEWDSSSFKAERDSSSFTAEWDISS